MGEACWIGFFQSVVVGVELRVKEGKINKSLHNRELFMGFP